ncbi:MAG: VWA domain-containing protein [Planctomycetota bacterium]|nr:VWA domain-containing protein [Planctomycetota bacterium]
MMETILSAFSPDLLLAAGETGQRVVLRWGNSYSWGWIAVAMAAIVSFSAAMYLLEPKVRKGFAKFGLFFLRAAIFLCCALILLNPIETTEDVKYRDAHTLVVIDKSCSMEVEDRYEEGDFTAALGEVTGQSYFQLREASRLKRVQRALSNQELGFLKKLREKNEVRVFSFDSDFERISRLRQLDSEAKKLTESDKKASIEELKKLINEGAAIEAINSLKPDGLSTSVGDSLNKIKRKLRGEKITSVILFSDGRQNAGSLDPIEESTNFGRRRIPIYTVGVGDPREAKDLEVDNYQIPKVTIAGDQITAECTVKAKGFEEPVEVEVKLSFRKKGEVEWQEIQSKNITVGGDQRERVVRFRAKPTEPGSYDTMVDVAQQPTEKTYDNNKAERPIRVIDKRIKVLYIDGYPRWEYRYLKNALIRDKSMDAQILLLSAEPNFPQEATRGLPRLRRIPTRKELFEYHVIILGDVNPEAKWPSTNQNVFQTDFWKNLTEFVGEFGGGLLVLSGERDLPRRFKTNPIAKALPVVIDGRRNTNARYTQIFYPNLTRTGIKSPLMRLDPDEQLNKLLWRPNGQGLPGFFWYERTIKAKPLARVLAIHPTESNEHGNYPLFAWQHYKSGTVFWSGVDSTWRWRAGVGDKFTYRFYGQIIRFLSHGRFQRSKRFFITTDKPEYNIGEDVRITARIYNQDLEPEKKAQWPAQIEVVSEGTTEKITLGLVDGKPGRYEGVYRVNAPGEYLASLEVNDIGASDEVAPRRFKVTLPSAEKLETRMDEVVLKKIAEKSGGKFFRLSQVSEIPDLIKSQRESIPTSSFDRTLWDLKPRMDWLIPYLLQIMLAILILEWIGRKVIRLM